MIATIGAFDGLHRGHRELLRTVIQRAEELGDESLCITFEPHPDVVLHPERPMYYLCEAEDKVAQIKAAGIDELHIVPFNQEVSQLSAVEFLDMVLADHPVRELLVGQGFAMGRNREGSVAYLQHMGESMGVKVRAISPVMDGGDAISSSRIRSLISQGDIARANTLLGWKYYIKGTVEVGARRGRQLGFPTANIRPSGRKMVPGEGVYFAIAVWNDALYPAMVNVGSRPTFGEDSHIVEAHLLGFSEELYGEALRLEFWQRLRDIRKFESAAALREQLGMDLESAAALAANWRAGPGSPGQE